MARLLGEAMKNLFRKPFTEKYPVERPKLPFDYRGKVVHIQKKCIYCGICAKYCPSGAITVDVKKKVWRIDYGRCLFCQQCEEACRDITFARTITIL